jgi:hypothetical protein
MFIQLALHGFQSLSRHYFPVHHFFFIFHSRVHIAPNNASCFLYARVVVSMHIFSLKSFRICDILCHYHKYASEPEDEQIQVCLHFSICECGGLKLTVYEAFTD